MSDNSLNTKNKQTQKHRNNAISLQCKQAEDLEVVSSLLQDALVSNIDLHFANTENSFLFIANRFCWEAVTNKLSKKCFYRVLTGINIQNVISVKHKNFIQHKDGQAALFYNLLTIRYDNGKNEVTLLFSQNVSVKLIVLELDIFIRDIVMPYPTTQIPEHIG